MDVDLEVISGRERAPLLTPRDLKFLMNWDSKSKFIFKNKVFKQKKFSLDPIRPYDNQTIKLELPGDRTIFNINWFSIYDLHTNEVMGSIFIPDKLNVPPSLTKILVSFLFYKYF